MILNFIKMFFINVCNNKRTFVLADSGGERRWTVFDGCSIEINNTPLRPDDPQLKIYFRDNNEIYLLVKPHERLPMVRVNEPINPEL